jgi:hypothetical protein
MRSPLLLGLLGLALLASGCYEERDTLTVYPDGSGVFRTHKKYGDTYSQLALSNRKPQELQASMDKALYKDLARWEGFSAWTGCRAYLDDKLIVNDAVGYFDNVAKLRLIDGTTIDRFTWTKNADGGFTITWSNLDPNAKDPLETPTTPPAQVQQVLTMLKGLKVDHEVVLPGAVASSRGCLIQSGRSATAELTDNDVADYFTTLEDYRARVDKGALSRAEANSELKDKIRDMSLNLQATCAPGNVDAEFAQFRKDYARAKSDYASAGTAKKILDALKN